MTQLFARVVVFVNNSGRVIQIKEYRRLGSGGGFYDSIELKSAKPEEIGATKYHRQSMEAGRPTVLKIFVDGVDSGKALSPQDCIVYAKIMISSGESGEVVVKGVKARPTDICRLRGLGFILGRDFKGRPEVLIA